MLNEQHAPYYTAYLVGQISSDPATYEWRRKFRKAFDGIGNITIIDPTLSEWNQNFLKDGVTTGNEVGQEIDRIGYKLMPGKDRNYVKIANIIIADLNHYTPEKMIIGSLFELAWTYDDPGKMVIGIYNGDPMENQLTRHPFVHNTVQVWVKDHETAIKLVKKFMDLPSNEIKEEPVNWYDLEVK